MKTCPNYPRNPHDTGSLLRSLIVAAIGFVIVLFFTSCTVTTAPDGTQTRKPDYNAWLEITRLILADEIPQAPIAPTK